MKRVEVVAAVIQRGDGSFLLAQRPAGKAYAGYWEFPGGKVEQEESPAQALQRELREELGIEVTLAYPWITREYDYAHAAVTLRFFRVVNWRGEPHGREAQSLAWQPATGPTVDPLLPANGPVLRALRLPAVYGISNAAALGTEAFLQRFNRALADGLHLVQLREKDLAPSAMRTLAASVIAAAHRHGASVMVNGTTELARELGADGVHLSAARLMATGSRPDMRLTGASCHNERELLHAAQVGVDFVVLGPVCPTLSHPGGAVLGWEAFARLIAGYPLPVFALGGLQKPDLDRAWRAGAHGIAMQRGAWPQLS